MKSCTRFLIAFTIILVCNPATASNPEQVTLSSSHILKTNQSIAEDYKARVNQAPFLIQRMSDHVYFIFVSGYNATVYVGDRGVLVIDPLSGGRWKNLLTAIRSLTQLPVTALVYSHSHMDHIGDAQAFISAVRQKQDETIRVIATAETLNNISRYNNPVPAVTELIKTPTGQIQFETLTIDVITPRDHAHSEDSSIYWFKQQRLAHYADFLTPGKIPFYNFSSAKDMRAAEDGARNFYQMDWVFFNGGHGPEGTKAHVRYYETYIQDMKAAVIKASAEFVFDPYGDPKKSFLKAFDDWASAITERVIEKLAPKYGHHLEFQDSVKSHVLRMAGDQVLHGYFEQ